MMRLEVPRCEVVGRKYVLVFNPSRWSQRGARVVVQSPMRSIPSTLENVPVKRFDGKEDNAVCFIPKKDIERDSSSIYEKLRVSRTEHWIEAHGVALFDSIPGEEFDYRQDDRFWIWIDADTNEDHTTVRVINLRTCESGYISLHRVCWYPKFQGPNHELWTLLGEKRVLKHSGSNFSRSWVICQKLNDFTTTKNVELSVNGIKTPDIFELSRNDRRFLFEQKYQYVQEAIRRAEYRATIFALGPTPVMMTSPSSHSLAIVKGTDMRLIRQTILRLPTRTSVNSSPGRKGVLESDNNRKERLWTPQRGNSTHAGNWSVPPSESNRFQTECEYQSSRDPTPKQRVTTLFGGSEGPVSSRSQTPSASPFGWHNEQPFSPELANLDGADLLGASLLMEISRAGNVPSPGNTSGVNPASRLLFSPTNPEVLSGSVSINQLHQMEMATERHNSDRAQVASLCNLGYDDCRYSSRFPFRHYHSPTTKCRLETYQKDPHQKYANQEDPPHEHCIFESCAFPGLVGKCIFSTMPSLGHSCCYWDEADRIEWPLAPKRVIDERKLKEAGHKRMRMLD